MTRRLLAVLVAVTLGVVIAPPAAAALPIAAAAALPIAAAAAPGPGSAPQYWFDDWGVYDLWNAGARGQGVTVATIDTGVNAALPELSGRVLPGTDLGLGGNGQTDRDRSRFGHGTAMASIIVARPGLLDITGVAPDARVLPVAVPLNGTTDAQRPDRLPEAIRYSADRGAKIISMSLGGKRDADEDQESCPADEQAAVFYAMRKGAVVLASVGNTGPRRNVIEEPGVCLGVVSVGAVDAAGRVASFSTRQPYLTMVAPGVEVASLGRVAGSAFSGDGTSQATALASGVAAMVWSRYPTLTPRQLVARLLATLDRPRGSRSAYGLGELNAARAVTDRVPATAPNPVYDAAAPFLRRSAALGRPAAAGAAAPRPARATAAPDPATVGSVPRVSSTLVLSAAAGLLGLAAAIALVVVGLRRRRRRSLYGWSMDAFDEARPPG
ncbi:type VII secretion-associated serine protease mycosin [Jatrophihabitans fulvus]